MKLYAGNDLHSNNNFWGIIDESGKRIFYKKLPNSPEKILSTLEPFKPDLATIAVDLQLVLDSRPAHGARIYGWLTLLQ